VETLDLVYFFMLSIARYTIPQQSTVTRGRWAKGSMRCVERKTTGDALLSGGRREDTPDLSGAGQVKLLSQQASQIIR